MKKFTENQAVSIVTSNGGEISGKRIMARGGFKGLRTCAAFDFLINHCGYVSNI